MAFGDRYSIGTASLDDTDLDIVHVDGSLLLSNALVDDTFEYAGRKVSILEVISDGSFRLRYEWPDTPFTDIAEGDWAIVQDSPLRNIPYSLARNLRDQYDRLRIFDQSKPILGMVEFGVNTPPEDYAVNDMLVVGSAPTGAFEGRSNSIARWTEESTWFFITPEFGWHIISESDPIIPNTVRSWNGAEWSPTSGLASSIKYRGAWDNGADYDVGDVVKHNLKFWIAKSSGTNQEPGDVSDYWDQYGFAGEHGGVPIALTFDDDITSAEPSSGKVKLNSGTATSVTVLRISKTDLYGGSRASQIAAIGNVTSAIKGRVRLQKIGSTVDFQANVTAVSESTNSYNLTLASGVAPNGFFSNADNVLFYFTPTGDKGDTGSKGDTGDTGATGRPGGFVAIPLIVDANSQANSDPGNGVVRFNAQSQSLSTAIYVDLLSALGASLQAILDSITSASTSTVKVSGQIFDAATYTKYIAFDVTAVTTATGYRILSITPRGASSSAPFSHGELVWLTWVPKGDKGDAATVAVGTVTVAEEDELPSVANSGSSTAAVLDFKLPRGPRGLPLQPWRAVANIAQRDALDHLSPTLDDGNQRSVLVQSDETAGGVSSLYYLITARNDPDPAEWIGPFDPVGVTAEVLEQVLAEQPDPVAMAMIF